MAENKTQAHDPATLRPSFRRFRASGRGALMDWRSTRYFDRLTGWHAHVGRRLLGLWQLSFTATRAGGEGGQPSHRISAPEGETCSAVYFMPGYADFGRCLGPSGQDARWARPVFISNKLADIRHGRSGPELIRAGLGDPEPEIPGYQGQLSIYSIS